MSLLRRMRDITVATLNERLEKSEDPIKLIDQFLYDRREQIQELEKIYRQTLNHAHSMRSQYLSAEELKSRRENQAALALKAGEEQMARLALQEKMQYEERSEQYRLLYEQSKQTIIDLEDQLNLYKSEYQEVYAKRQYFMDRMEAIRLQRRMNDHFGAGGVSLGTRAFQRLEDRVSDLEYETRALRDIRRADQVPGPSAANATSQAIDAELEALRRKMEQEGG